MQEEYEAWGQAEIGAKTKAQVPTQAREIEKHWLSEERGLVEDEGNSGTVLLGPVRTVRSYLRDPQEV